MAWTGITRPKYRRDGLRYASDTTDEEWAVIEPHLPPPAKLGRTRATSLRDAVNAIYYIAQSGCQWRVLPKDFPPYSTAQRYFMIGAIELVKRSDVAKDFVLLPRRWAVERTFAWLNRNRRVAKDVEATIESAVTWLYIASAKLMSRRLAAA